MALKFKYQSVALSVVVLFLLISSIATPVFAASQDTNQLSLLNQSTDALGRRLAKLVKEKEFGTVNRFIDMLVRDKPSNIDGSRVLEIVYRQMAWSITDMGLLDQWLNDTGHHAAYIVRGRKNIDKAWEARGTYLAYTVKSVQLKQMAGYVEKAKKDLTVAHKIQPKDPNAAANMIEVALLSHLDRPEMESWFQKATEADPIALEAYFKKLSYLCPWWYGTQIEFNQYAAWCFDHSPPGSKVYVIAIEYIFQLASRVSDTASFYGSPQITALAQAVFQRWGKDFPNSVALRSCQGSFETGLGHYEKAVAYYTEALSMDPDSVSALVGRADLLYEEIHDKDGALRDYRKILKIDPRNDWAMFRVGAIAYYYDGDPKTAEKYCTYAINQNPKSRLYHRIRGETRLSMRDHKGAIEDFTAAITIDPKYAASYIRRAFAKQVLEDYEGALGDLTTALAVDPKNAEAIFERGSLNFRLGHYAQARIDLQEAKYLNQGRAKAVDQMLSHMDADKTLKQQPAPRQQNEKTSYPPPGAMSGPIKPPVRVVQERGETAEMRELFQKGFAAFMNGDDTAAKMAYNTVLAKHPDNLKALQGLVNVAYRDHNDLPEAEALFRKMTTIDPADPQNLMNLGVVSFDQGKYEAGIDYFTQVMSMQQHFGPAFWYRGECHRMLKAFGKARDDYLKAKEYGGLPSQQIDQRLAELSQ